MILCPGELPGDRAACFSSWLCTRTIAHGLLRAAVWDLKLEFGTALLTTHLEVILAVALGS